MTLRGLNEFAGVKGAENLVRYITSHAETPRALCLCGHILALYYLAGWGVTVVQPGQLPPVKKRAVSVALENINSFESLHNVEDLGHLIKSVQVRLTYGQVSENWITDFYKAAGVDH